MNFMAYGLPVLAAVNPSSEVARIVRDAGAGWVVNSAEPNSFPAEVARLSEVPEEVGERAAASRAFAEQHFTRERFAEHFDRLLRDVVTERRPAGTLAPQ